MLARNRAHVSLCVTMQAKAARDKKMLIRHVRHGAKAPARTGTDALPDVWVLSRAHVYTRGVGKVILS